MRNEWISKVCIIEYMDFKGYIIESIVLVFRSDGTSCVWVQSRA